MPDSEHTPDIETGADTLLDFLEKKSRYSVSQISEDLGIPEEQVEKWARALENSGLLEIDYSAIKGMVLEYASDKSVDELNRGRHELSLEADTVEINVEDIEEAHDAVEGKDSEAGFVGKAEEKDTEEDKERKKTGAEEGSESTGENELGTGSAEESTEEGEFKEPVDKSGEGSSDGKDIDFGDSSSSTNSSKQGSNQDSGRDVSISENESDEDDGGPSVTMKAKKAMLNKMKHNNEGSDAGQSGGSGEGSPGSSVSKASDKNVSDEIDSNLSHVKSKSSGKYQSEEDIDWNPGENIEEVNQNIKELSDLLLDPEVDDEEVYDRIDYQTEVLKDKLKEKPLDEREDKEELREDIVTTIETLNKKIEESDSAKSYLKGFIAIIKDYLARIVHAIGIKKVE